MPESTADKEDQPLALIAVVGLTPQVVTFTLHALIDLPRRIVVLTTNYGLRKSGDGLKTKVNALYRQRGRPEPDLSVVSYDTSTGDIVHGADVIGFRRMADQTMSGLLEQKYCIHMSVAGGRNAMVSVGTQTLEMHGRRGDRLSQVLVVPPEAMLSGDLEHVWWPTDDDPRMPPTIPVRHFDAEKNVVSALPKPMSPRELEVRLIDIDFTPWNDLKPDVGVDWRRRRQLYRVATHQSINARPADHDPRHLVLTAPVESDFCAVIGPSDTEFAAPADPAVLRVTIQPKSMALLWWIVTESARDRTGGACWSRQALEDAAGRDVASMIDPAPFVRYLRLVAWLCDQELLETASEQFIAQSLRGTGPGTVCSRNARKLLKMAGDAPAVDLDRAADWPMRQDHAHLMEALRPLGPLADLLAGTWDSGRARVDPVANIELGDQWHGWC